MNESRQIAINVIRTYIRELENMEQFEWQMRHLAQIYYSKIAAIKILHQIKTDESLSPMTIVENFRDKTDRYACVNEFNSMMFSIQCDAAKYILDDIVVHYERRKSKWTNQN